MTEKEMRERSAQVNEPHYRYIKRIVLFVILGIICLILEMWLIGIILIAMGGCYGLLSYIQRFKYATSVEELTLKELKKKKVEKKYKKNELKEALQNRLDEIEKEFDFDYNNMQDLICIHCGTCITLKPREGHIPTCPICNNAMVPRDEVDEEEEDFDDE